MAIPAVGQSTKVCKPAEGSFHNPALARNFLEDFGHPPVGFVVSIFPLGNARPDAPTTQTLHEGSAVISFVCSQSTHSGARTTFVPGQIQFSQRGMGQSDIMHIARVDRGRQRDAIPIDEKRSFCTTTQLGYTDFGAPFLARAKLESRKPLAHSKRLSSSRFLSMPRQTWSQTPASSHWIKRRQQVTGEPYWMGMFFQQAPERRTQRIPLIVFRSSALGRPRFFGLGKRGLMRAHWASVNSSIGNSSHSWGSPNLTGI